MGKREQQAADALRERLLSNDPITPDDMVQIVLSAAKHQDEIDRQKAQTRTLKRAWAFLIIVLVVIGATILVATA